MRPSGPPGSGCQAPALLRGVSRRGTRVRFLQHPISQAPQAPRPHWGCNVPVTEPCVRIMGRGVYHTLRNPAKDKENDADHSGPDPVE